MAQENSQRKAFIETLKLALATSIIRSKPDNVTAKEHAHYLAKTIKNTETTWKSKVAQLSDELEKCKQEVILLRLKNDNFDERKASVQEECANVVMSTDITKHLNLQGNSKFLLSVVAFSKWYRVLQNDMSMLVTLENSLKQSLQDFESSIGTISVNNHNLALMEENTKIMTELLKHEQFNTNKIVQQCCDGIVKSVIRSVMNSKAENAILDCSCAFLVSLSQTCVSLRNSVVENLFVIITGYSNILKELPSINSLDVKKYENMFYICETMEEILMTTMPLWPCKNDVCYSRSLENGLLDISDIFPMYSHKIWMISSLMAAVDDVHRQEDGRNIWKLNM